MIEPDPAMMLLEGSVTLAMALLPGGSGWLSLLVDMPELFGLYRVF